MEKIDFLKQRVVKKLKVATLKFVLIWNMNSGDFFFFPLNLWFFFNFGFSLNVISEP